MRTISVRLSLAEHRLVNDLAGARGVSVETLVREAMSLAPFELPSAPRLQIVRADELGPATDGRESPSGPSR